METSLHRQLKLLYADPHAQFEVPVDKFRIDVVSRRRLIEIQHGALSAIQKKVCQLVEDHKVWVVKPIVHRKQLVKLTKKGGAEKHRRMSPKRGRIVELFHDMIHFTRAFPHKNLTIDVPIVDIVEYRYPGHGRRRRWRKNDFIIEDQRLRQVLALYRIRTVGDLGRLLLCELDNSDQTLPKRFDTSELADVLDIPRWIAQRVAYCLRETGAFQEAGRRGNARVYTFRVRRGRSLIVDTLPNGQAILPPDPDSHHTVTSRRRAA